jgi:hypothetical protein
MGNDPTQRCAPALQESISVAEQTRRRSRRRKAWAIILSLIFIMVGNIVNIHLILDTLANKYDQILGEYLAQTLSIREFDKQAEALYYLKPVSTATTYKSHQSAEISCLDDSHLGSKWVCLRNDIHIERLNPTDLNLLRSANTSDPSENKDLLSMVAKTYVDVLGSRVRSSDGGYYDTVLYGDPWDNAEIVPADTIVFWFEYMDGANPRGTTNTVSEMNELIDEYSQKFSNELGHSVKVFARWVI